MCSTSNVNDALKGVPSDGGGIISSISAHKFRQNRSSYLLVDIREESEILLTKPIPEVDAKMTMGAICHDASELFAQAQAGDGHQKRTIVLLCNTGVRAEMAAQSVVAQSTASSAAVAVAVLQRGIVGWENAAALSPDFLVVLGVGGDSSEKLSLSLAAAAAAVDMHETVVLVLMSEGVNWFVTPDSLQKEMNPSENSTANVNNVSHGAPFKPCKAMLHKFVSNGGVILACTTCVKHRGYSFDEDMMDCVSPMQIPDLVRMMGEAKGGCLQFM
jgi:rhodanese-related sulfurtransferase/sulfur relay (sulfurtransferase) complex TusBCD TusD component (DsrE family)